jgi:hypothetical protein
MAGVWADGCFSALNSSSHWLRCHQPLQELVHWHALIATFRHDQGLQDCHTECWLSSRLFSRDRVGIAFDQSYEVFRNSPLELKTRVPSMIFEHSEIDPRLWLTATSPSSGLSEAPVTGGESSRAAQSLLFVLWMIGRKFAQAHEDCKCWPGGYQRLRTIWGPSGCRYRTASIYRLEPHNVCFFFPFPPYVLNFEHRTTPSRSLCWFWKSKELFNSKSLSYLQLRQIREGFTSFDPRTFGSLEAKADPRFYKWCFKRDIAQHLPRLKAHHAFHAYELPSGSPLPRQHNSLTPSLLELSLHLAMSRQHNPKCNQFEYVEYSWERHHLR